MEQRRLARGDFLIGRRDGLAAAPEIEQGLARHDTADVVGSPAADIRPPRPPECHRETDGNPACWRPGRDRPVRSPDRSPRSGDRDAGAATVARAASSVSGSADATLSHAPCQQYDPDCHASLALLVLGERPGRVGAFGHIAAEQQELGLILGRTGVSGRPPCRRDRKTAASAWRAPDWPAQRLSRWLPCPGNRSSRCRR